MTRRERTSISVQEVADILGVSVSTIRRLLAERAFPNAFRVGRQIRIPRIDVDAFQVRERLSMSGHT
jgi:excisionase family DNA binding protein